ncbi:FAD-dependent monooxygenase [Micromonospora sp. NPDC051300]|uniref:FAD-dependent monooxygenase n=1 Tax=Micromonospora sp. NPDC051300 TaxID=3364286 RepID=UPI003799D7D6
MTQKRVLLSGAGIAGATAAYWLARTGWQVTVVEKAAGVRSSGNPVDVRGEAASVVRQMQLWPRLQEAATGVSRLVVLDAGGHRRAVVGTRQTADAGSEVEVARSVLAGTLLDAARDQAEVIVGDSIAALTQDADGVDVRFEQGSPRRFDLVLGADGLHSAVRRLAFGPEQRFANPFGMYVGTMRTSISGGDPHEVLLFNRPGISLSIHPAGGSPLAAFIFRSGEPYDHHDREAAKRLVRAAYAGKGWVTDQAVADWLVADDVYFDAVTRIVMPSWARGRVVLLGDAADCISLLGEGSSNAIVAAKALADALAEHPGQHGAAFAAYEATHRRRLRSFHRRAGLISHFLVPATDLGLRVRNTGLRLTSLFARP